MHFAKFFTATLAGVLLIGLSGCNQPGGSAPQEAEAEQSVDQVSSGHNHADHDHADHDHADHDHADHDHGGQAANETASSDDSMEKMMAGLADLPAEEHKSAMQQHICPVSGQMLGSMGTPEKVDVDGKQVWICCDGCRDKLLAEPDKYLAKLEK